MNRYIRQLSLPEMDLIKQDQLQKSCILVVGAGGLGSIALPYFAGSGIGHIVIVDHDTVDISNLHRQTIYRSEDHGQNKATLAQKYISRLNPHCNIEAITEKITEDNAHSLLGQYDFDLIFDGSDNFATKSMLNNLSIALTTPLISGSINQFSGQISVFKGYQADYPCYRCVFPEFPTDARNCNEAGILGTSAGMIGMMQAHLAMLHLLNINNDAKTFISVDLKTLQQTHIKTQHDPDCPFCTKKIYTPTQEKIMKQAELISIENLNDTPTVVVDVRQEEEISADPLQHENIEQQPIHIPLSELIDRIKELPEDKRLAFICAGNIRSKKAADYLLSTGVDNVCILDKFSL